MNAGPILPRSLALPLAIEANGQFARTDQMDTVMSVFGVMSVTAPGGWPHAPWFALLPLFERASQAEAQEFPTLADALNLALGRLGVDSMRVERVVRSDETNEHGVRGFAIALALEGGSIVQRSLPV